MKAFICTLYFLMGLGLLPEPAPPTSQQLENRIDVVFNGTHTFQDMVQIQAELSKKNITLTYLQLAFSEEGNLTEVEFKVDCNDGFTGSAWSDKLAQGKRTGFYRDYSEDSLSPFGTF